MPTPFMHLQTAEQMRAALHQDPSAFPLLVQDLDEMWPAFYFGHVAPDYQALCGVPREKTHFYDLPPEPRNKAYPRLFAQHPQVALASKLPRDQALFIGAYSAHLMLDLLWFREILIPYFVEANQDEAFIARRLRHHALLAYLDEQARASLPENAAADLAAAQPVGYLPFAADAELRSWRDYLARQLRPGADSETVRIYAGRMNMTADSFAAKLHNPAWLQSELKEKVPVATVERILRAAVPASLRLVESYLDGSLT